MSFEPSFVPGEQIEVLQRITWKGTLCEVGEILTVVSDCGVTALCLNALEQEVVVWSPKYKAGEVQKFCARPNDWGADLELV